MTIDADLQDDPAEIPQLLAKLDEGFDLVSGLEDTAQRPVPAARCSRASSTGRPALISGVRLHDVNCGLKAYRAEVLQGMRLYGELHRFIPVLAAYQGYPHRRDPGEPPRRASTAARATGPSATCAASSTSSASRSWAATDTGRSTSSAASGCSWVRSASSSSSTSRCSGSGAQGIGTRPLLTLGVLLMVVGIQFVSLGLISELITSQHEERIDERERTERMVEDVLR